jgi:hypothetical protein
MAHLLLDELEGSAPGAVEAVINSRTRNTAGTEGSPIGSWFRAPARPRRSCHLRVASTERQLQVQDRPNLTLPAHCWGRAPQYRPTTRSVGFVHTPGSVSKSTERLARSHASRLFRGSGIRAGGAESTHGRRGNSPRALTDAAGEAPDSTRRSSALPPAPTGRRHPPLDAAAGRLAPAARLDVRAIADRLLRLMAACSAPCT